MVTHTIKMVTEKVLCKENTVEKVSTDTRDRMKLLQKDMKLVLLETSIEKLEISSKNLLMNGK